MMLACPAIYLECLAPDPDLSDLDRLDAAGAEAWEVLAWQAIRSGAIGKGGLDVIDIGGILVLGHYHLAYRYIDLDVLGMGLRAADRDIEAWALAVLYADRADYDYGIQRKDNSPLRYRPEDLDDFVANGRTEGDEE